MELNKREETLGMIDSKNTQKQIELDLLIKSNLEREKELRNLKLSSDMEKEKLIEEKNILLLQIKKFNNQKQTLELNQ